MAMRMDTRRASTVPVIFCLLQYCISRNLSVNKLILEVFILTETEGVLIILIIMTIFTKHAENIWKNFFQLATISPNSVTGTFLFDNALDTL